MGTRVRPVRLVGHTAPRARLELPGVPHGGPRLELPGVPHGGPRQSERCSRAPKLRVKPPLKLRLKPPLKLRLKAPLKPCLGAPPRTSELVDQLFSKT